MKSANPSHRVSICISGSPWNRPLMQFADITFARYLQPADGIFAACTWGISLTQNQPEDHRVLYQAMASWRPLSRCFLFPNAFSFMSSSSSGLICLGNYLLYLPHPQPTNLIVVDRRASHYWDEDGGVYNVCSSAWCQIGWCVSTLFPHQFDFTTW